MLRNSSIWSIVVAGILLLLPGRVSAAPIVLNPNGAGAQIHAFEPVGQSFTAEDAFVSAGLYIFPINNSPPWPVDTLQYDLYQGSGIGGALLATVFFNPGAGFEGFYDVDFSATPLVVGEVYSLVVSNPGTSPYWGMQPSSANYAGGSSIYNGVLGSGPFNNITDNALRVTPIQPVPEPTTLMLIGSGIVAGLRQRRRLRM